MARGWWVGGWWWWVDEECEERMVSCLQITRGTSEAPPTTPRRASKDERAR